MSVESPPARIVEECYVRGGQGNAKLIGWEFRRVTDGDVDYSKGGIENKKLSKLDLEKLDDTLANRLREGLYNSYSNIDYIKKQNYPKEWENIKSAAHAFKLSKKDKSIITLFLGSIFSLIGWLLTIFL